ncbi:hypothetical protein [Algihabitans sp.]|uniref:hypothetical protein n=1 Tax=Algihabitans sp. TaxID=2821514 RepID=UPI003BAB6379
MTRSRRGYRQLWRNVGLGGLVFFASATPALAYIGPGGGLSALGAILALFAAAGLALVGFVWFPIKRMRAARQKARQGSANTAESRGRSG